MTDDEDYREVRERALEGVRMSFRMVEELEHRERRTDMFLFAATIVAVILLSLATMDGIVEGFGLGLGYALGVLAGGVIVVRKGRRRSFLLLKEHYHEIELQNMILEEEEAE